MDVIELIAKIFEMEEECCCENCQHYKEYARECMATNFGLFSTFLHKTILRVNVDRHGAYQYKELLLCSYFKPMEEK